MSIPRKKKPGEKILDFDVQEVSLCADPANPLSVITLVKSARSAADRTLTEVQRSSRDSLVRLVVVRSREASFYEAARKSAREYPALLKAADLNVRQLAAAAFNAAGE